MGSGELSKLCKLMRADLIVSTGDQAVPRVSRQMAPVTEETFGWKFQDFRSHVKSVVGHYLELLDAAKAA